MPMTRISVPIYESLVSHNDFSDRPLWMLSFFSRNFEASNNNWSLYVQLPFWFGPNNFVLSLKVTYSYFGLITTQKVGRFITVAVLRVLSLTAYLIASAKSVSFWREFLKCFFLINTFCNLQSILSIHISFIDRFLGHWPGLDILKLIFA